MRALAVSLLAPLALAACGSITSAESRAQDPGSAGPFVLGVQTHFGQSWSPTLLRLVSDAEAPMLRDTVRWADIEKTPGQYDLGNARLAPLRQACKDGRQLLLALDPRNPLYDNGLSATSDSGQRAFTNYVLALLDSFQGCVTALEIGNEINTTGAFPVATDEDNIVVYFRLLQRLYPTVKAKHGDVTILGGSTNVIGTGFLAELFESHMLDYMDAVAVHPYRNHAENVDFELAHLRDVMARYGKIVPIWATEFSDEYDTPEQAAPSMLKMVSLMGAAGVARASWFQLIDEKWYRNMGLYTADGASKPAAQAFRMIETQLLPKGRPVRVDAGDRRTFLFRYGSDGWVVWGDPRPLHVANDARVLDARGLAIAPPAAIGPDPVLIFGAAPQLGEGAVLGDSLYEYGAEPWEYLAQNRDDLPKPVNVIDSDFASAFGSRYLKPLKINDVSGAPAGNADDPVHAVIRYTAPAAGQVTVLGCFGKDAGGDGVDVALAKNGTPLRKAVLTQKLVVAEPGVTLAKGDTLDFSVGPNKTYGSDSFRYRIRIVAAGAPVPACDPGTGG